MGQNASAHAPSAKNKQYQVFRNGVSIGCTSAATKNAAKVWVAKNVLSTHMGEWRKRLGGYQYATTIGVTYDFEPVLKLKVGL